MNSAIALKSRFRRLTEAPTRDPSGTRPHGISHGSLRRRTFIDFLTPGSQVRRYLRAKTRSRGDAQDLLQEAWIKLARNGATAIAAPIPYLMHIARSFLLDYGRSESRRLQRSEVADILSAADEQPGPETIARDPDQLRHITDITGIANARS